MTSMEVDQREVLGFEQVRALLGKATRPDGRPIARGTMYRLIHDEGLPAHQLVPGGRFYFYADEVRAFVGNRWNRRTPAHRGRGGGESGES